MAAFAATLLPAGLVLAQLPFALDTTFRTVITQQNVNDMLLSEDGKVILSGQMQFPGEFTTKTLVRLLNDGARDETFNNSGLGGGRLVAWQDKFYTGPYVRRILPDGNVDPSFMSLNSNPYFNSGTGGDYHVFEDGRVLLTGQHTLSDVVRGFTGIHHAVFFQSTGYLDTTRTHRKAVGTIWRVKEQADGRILCGGAVSQYDNTPVPPVFRIHPDGSLDTSFQSVTTWGNTFLYNFIPLPDGRFYQTGFFGTSVTGSDTLYLARFMPDGQLDPTFTPPNLGLIDMPGPVNASGRGVLPWSDGRLLLHGRFQTVNGQVRRGLCLLDTTGVLLDAFQDAGVGPYTYQGLTSASVSAVVIDSINNHLYICGTYTGYNDGLTNDPLQRFVSRLHLGDLVTDVGQHVQRAENNFTAHPNPASSYVVLSHRVPNNKSTLQLVVRDLDGRVVKQLSTSGEEGQTVWDTRGFTPGVYTVELQQQGQVLKTLRVVIQP